MPGGFPGAPGGATGRPGELANDQIFAPRGPHEAPHAFFGSTNPPRAAQKRPGNLQALIWCPLGPFGGIISLMFAAFPNLISRSFRLLFSLVFASLLVCALCLFKGWEAFIFKVGTPRFLKPWLAAGGREAIRISYEIWNF